jgi:hypothetical protein
MFSYKSIWSTYFEDVIKAAQGLLSVGTMYMELRYTIKRKLINPFALVSV